MSPWKWEKKTAIEKAKERLTTVPIGDVGAVALDEAWHLDPVFMRGAQRAFEKGGAFEPVIRDPYEPDVSLFDRVQAGAYRNPWMRK